MPRIRGVVIKLNTPFVDRGHVAGSMATRLSLVPEPWWVQDVNQLEGTIPLSWNAKRLGVNVGGLQG